MKKTVSSVSPSISAGVWNASMKPTHATIRSSKNGRKTPSSGDATQPREQTTGVIKLGY